MRTIFEIDLRLQYLLSDTTDERANQWMTEFRGKQGWKFSDMLPDEGLLNEQMRTFYAYICQISHAGNAESCTPILEENDGKVGLHNGPLEDEDNVLMAAGMLAETARLCLNISRTVGLLFEKDATLEAANTEIHKLPYGQKRVAAVQKIFAEHPETEEQIKSIVEGIANV